MTRLGRALALAWLALLALASLLGRALGSGADALQPHLASASTPEWLAWWALATQPRAKSASQGRRTVNEAIQEVARRLGNTLATCRKAYVHPAVVESYLDGRLETRPRRRGRAASRSTTSPRLRPSESSLLRLLAEG